MSDKTQAIAGGLRLIADGSYLTIGGSEVIRMAAEEIERLQKADRLRTEDDEASEKEWLALVYILVDAANTTRGESIPEDVEHA
jgi:hypothetical protein